MIEEGGGETNHIEYLYFLMGLDYGGRREGPEFHCHITYCPLVCIDFFL